MANVVIMCGGLGTRLHGLTKDRPKPMLPVGSKPMLETIIERFRDQGFKEFTLCVRYRAELIEEYFGDGARHGVHITYIREEEPLGTAGALRLLPKQSRPFIVSNCDVWCEIDYRDLLARHNEHPMDATVCLALYQHQVPFGVVDVDDEGRLSEIAEKPIKNYYINAGIYVLPPYAPDVIAPGEKIDMPDLLSKLTRWSYPIDGQWLDLGHFDVLAKASYNETLRAVK